MRALGTIGGSLANNDPAACYPAAVLALDATIVTDRRRIAADDFFVGMYETALAPDELIIAVEFPVAERSAYEKFRNPASHFALVGVFVAKRARRRARRGDGRGSFGISRDGTGKRAHGRISRRRPRGASPCPHDDLNTDMHASAEYRAHLIPVLAARAVTTRGHDGVLQA